MKNLLLLLIFLPLFSLSQTQGPGYNYWDFQLDSISESQLQWDSTHNENLIWDYGDNQKVFFGDSLNPILVTDTVNMYDTLIDASVDLILTRAVDGSNTTIEDAGYVLEFYHKLDTDTSSAGGYFEICLDDDSTTYIKNGDTLKTYWLRFLLNSGDTTNQSPYGQIQPLYKMISDNGDTISPPEAGGAPTYFYHEIYGYHDSLFNGTVGFTGTYSEYKYFFMDFQYGAGGIKASDMDDTLRFRFHFVSDSTSSGKNGWALKDIKSGYSVHPTGGVDNLHGNNFIVYPNPVRDEIFIKSTQEISVKNYQFEVYNLNGSLITKESLNGNASISISNLEAGLYLLVIKSSEGIVVESKRFVKQ
ncbi:MAG: T9SS type A sorting domain-containing protein [Crocinitomicaceae bacterium]